MARVLGLQRWLCALGLMLVRCSLIEGSPPSGQCSTDADCERSSALRGLVCNVQYGVCVSRQALQPTADACETSEVCTEQNGGSASQCRAGGKPCIPLVTEECDQVSGDWQLADTLFIGAIGSRTFLETNGNSVDLLWAQYATRAIDLALDEWIGPRPDGVTTSGSSLAVIHCDARRDPERTLRAFEHLQRTVRVKAMIALGDEERTIISDAAKEAGIPVLCAGCGERAQASSTSVPNAWNMQPALEDQARLVVERTRGLERQLRSERSLSDDDRIRVVLVTQDSPRHRAFLAAVQSQLTFNGGLTALGQSDSSYLEVRLPDPRYDNVDALTISKQIVDYRPDVVLAGMDSFDASVYLRMVEQQWGPEEPRPFYVVTAENRELQLLETLDRTSFDLHLRLSGTAPLVNEQVARNHSAFVERFRAANELRDPGEIQGAYDALYATAYAFYAADLLQLFVGDRFADGLARLLSGPGVNIDPDDIISGKTYLAEGGSIDIVGTASDLSWDPSTGGISSDVTLWCLGRDAQGALVIHDDAGVHWDRTRDEITGTYACPP